MDSLSMRDVVEILMGSAFYFDLNLKERHSLVTRILEMCTHDHGRDGRACSACGQFRMSVPLSML